MTKDGINLKELAEKRNLNILHIIMASFLAQLAEMGYLNQGSTNIMGTAVGRRVGRFLKDSKILSGETDEVTVLQKISQAIDLSDEIKIEKDSNTDKILIKINSSLCKYCPKGVGGAEIPGTVCSVPYFLMAILEELLGKSYIVIPWEIKEKHFSIKKPLKKEGGYCLFSLRQKKQST